MFKKQLEIPSSENHQRVLMFSQLIDSSKQNPSYGRFFPYNELARKQTETIIFNLQNILTQSRFAKILRSTELSHPTVN